MLTERLRIAGKEIVVPVTPIDRLVNWVDPVRGLRRYRARAMQAVVGSYRGASTSRRAVKEWSVPSQDADSDILWDLPTLRDRSRDLIRNAPVANSAINTSLMNVVGTGLKLQARLDTEALGLSEDQADAWENHAERLFRFWAESQECDISRTLNFYGLQWLAFRQTIEAGDSFALLPRIRRAGSPFLLKLNLVEADRVCNKDNAGDTEELVCGVSKDKATGAPLAYHILDRHPGMTKYVKQGAKTWQEVPAFGASTGLRNVLHLYEVLRPGQTRGVPYLSPIMETLKQLDRYTEAEIMAAVISGLFTVFVKSETGAVDFDSLTGMAAETGASASDDDLKMGNGAIIGLKKGEDITIAAPNRPNAQFDPFFKAIIMQIGAALGIPGEVLLRSFNASYSASRAALLEAWRFFRCRRAWLVQAFCQPVYEVWLYEAVAAGMIAAPGFFADPFIRKAYSGAIWCGDSPGYIDPAKEIGPAKDRLDAMLSTYDEETALLGGDFEKNVRQRAKEKRMLERAGLIAADNKTLPAGGGDDEDP